MFAWLYLLFAILLFLVALIQVIWLTRKFGFPCSKSLPRSERFLYVKLDAHYLFLLIAITYGPRSYQVFHLFSESVIFILLLASLARAHLAFFFLWLSLQCSKHNILWSQYMCSSYLVVSGDVDVDYSDIWYELLFLCSRRKISFHPRIFLFAFFSKCDRVSHHCMRRTFASYMGDVRAFLSASLLS